MQRKFPCSCRYGWIGILSLWWIPILWFGSLRSSPESCWSRHRSAQTQTCSGSNPLLMRKTTKSSGYWGCRKGSKTSIKQIRSLGAGNIVVSELRWWVAKPEGGGRVLLQNAFSPPRSSSLPRRDSVSWTLSNSAPPASEEAGSVSSLMYWKTATWEWKN